MIGRVADVAAFGANDQGNHVTGFDGHFAQFRRVGRGGNRLRAGSVGRTVDQTVSVGFRRTALPDHSMPLPPL